MKKYNVHAIGYDKRGRILAEGKNSYTKTHPLQAHYAAKIGGEHAERIFLHAEMDALIKSKETPHTLEVMVFSRAGNVCQSKPCPICMEALKDSGVKYIRYVKEGKDGRKKITKRRCA